MYRIILFGFCMVSIGIDLVRSIYVVVEHQLIPPLSGSDSIFFHACAFVLFASWFCAAIGEKK